MAKTQEKETKENQKKAPVAATVSRILWGDFLSSKFFSDNKFTVIIVIALLMLYITFKYECQTHMETIAKLETELSIVKSESIREQSSFKSRTRESYMQNSIDSLGLNLRVQSQPPYILKYEK